jgi:hypothetical protein
MFYFFNKKDSKTQDNYEIRLKFDPSTLTKICEIPYSVNYYLTHLDNNQLIVNTANSYQNMYGGGRTAVLNYQPNKGSKGNIVFKDRGGVSHNFTIIKNNKTTDKTIWGVGGCGKNTKMKAGLQYYDGIYLLYSKDNMKTWKDHGLIINADDAKGWNPRGDTNFDSNITCFYSEILKKYLLFTRYNIGGGSRGIQVFTSENIKHGWDNGKLCKIDGYSKKENYYMNKIIELVEYKLFLMVVPFSDLERRNPTGTKVLLSKDAIHWQDCGLLFESKVVCKHSSTPKIQPVGIDCKSDHKIDLLFHDNYFSKNPSTLFSYKVDISKFIGYAIKKEFVYKEKFKIKTHHIKIECDFHNDNDNNNDNKSYVKLQYNDQVYHLDMQSKIIQLPASFTKNKGYRFVWLFKNVTVYSYLFV